MTSALAHSSTPVLLWRERTGRHSVLQMGKPNLGVEARAAPQLTRAQSVAVVTTLPTQRLQPRYPPSTSAVHLLPQERPPLSIISTFFVRTTLTLFNPFAPPSLPPTMSNSRVAVEDLDAGMHADPDAVNVLFVCLGNICRR